MKKFVSLFFFIIIVLGVVNTISASNKDSSYNTNALSASVNPVIRDCYWLFDNSWNGSHEIYDCLTCTINFVDNPRVQSTCQWPPF
jgi:hypothetical protein